MVTLLLQRSHAAALRIYFACKHCYVKKTHRNGKSLTNYLSQRGNVTQKNIGSKSNKDLGFNSSCACF